MQYESPGVSVGGAWMMEQEALTRVKAIARTAYPRAGLVPGQSPAQPPVYPDPSRAGPGYDLVNGVAVVPVHGPIYRHATFLNDMIAFYMGGVSLDRLADALRLAVADPAVRSVLYSFDTPGGEASGIGEYARMIRAAAGSKPVAAFAQGMCCSAGYYLAAACGEITAAPGACVGSLGVVFPFVDDSAFQEQVGVVDAPVISVQSPDKWSDIGTPEGRAPWQRLADGMGAVFVKDVAEYRKTTADDVLANYGKGAVLPAADARKAGMIDKVGTLESVLQKLSGQHRANLKVHRPAAAAVSAPLRLRVRRA